MTDATQASCPLCEVGSPRLRLVDDVPYYHCRRCDFIFAAPSLLAAMDRGDLVRDYEADYWSAELRSARERSYGSSLARLAEAVLYTTIPIRNVVDIGSGPGFLLDALAGYLPTHQSRFHAVEKYPPPVGQRTAHRNYHATSLEALGMTFECGTCIEVLEHLTPTMAAGLAASMASVSVPGSLFLFNTGLTDYVLKEDPGYLDPYRRGHVTCWSVTAAAKVFSQHGFAVHALRGKTWAFVVEFDSAMRGGVEDRIWGAPAENVALLRDPAMGDALYLLGRESARAWH